MILSLTDLRKNRPQEQGEDYTLVVPELTVRAGEKILITGPSGSGKSTFLDLLGMVLRPDRATRFLFSPSRRSEEQLVGQTEGLCKGQAGNGPFDIARAWQAGRTEDLALWRRHVGYVLQTGGLLPFLRVSENIALPRRLFGLAEGRTVVELAEELNIAHLLNAYPARLSVGERQRAAIARALAAEPSLVLADEPTAALDPEHSEAVTDLFMRMVSSRNLTLILVTHAPEQMRGKDFRRLHITQQGQGVEGREAVLLPAPAEHTSSLGRSDAPHSNSTGRSNSAPETWLKERVEELRTIPERDFGMELAENHSALPQEEEPSLAELAALAALVQISGIATSQDMRELTDETQPSDWMRAQASWRGIDEDGEPIFSDESGNRRGTA